MGRKRNKKGGKEDVVKAEVAMAKAVRRVQEILRDHSEQEIRAMLLQCNMNHNVAIHRLLSHQETSNEVGATTQLPDSSITLVPNQSTITNGETRNVQISSPEAVPTLDVPSSSDVTNGEPMTMAINSSEAVPPLSVPSSSDITNGETRSVPTSSNLSLSLPSSSAKINGETRSVPISSNVAVRPLSVSSSRAPTNAKPKRKDTRMISAYGPRMVEVLRGLQIPSEQNLTKAPVTADSLLLHQKPDATNPIFNSFTESDAARDPQHSAFPMDTRQSIATASPLGPRPPEAFGGINSNTLAYHGNLMKYPHSWLKQNNASIYQSLELVFAEYRNNTLPQSATSTVPSSHGSDHDFDMSSGNAANSSRLGSEDVSRIHLPSNSTGPSSHSSAYGFDMSSGNAENSRLGYEDVTRIQGRSPFVWRAQGEDSCRSIPPHNQQEREAYFERMRADSASLDQEFITSDPSQQRPKDK